VKLITLVLINTFGSRFGFPIFVVMNNLKLLSKGIDSLPKFISSVLSIGFIN